MILLKKRIKKVYREGEHKHKIKFAWYPRREFDDNRSSKDEYGDLFWLEKYKITYRYTSNKKWRKLKVDRYENAVFDSLKG